MRRTLTSRFVESVPPPAEGRASYPDAALPGFELRVTAEGKKSFSLRYRIAGRQRRISWPYPAHSLAEAREEAKEALQEAEKGKDVAEDRQQAKSRQIELPTTLSALCDDYVKRHLKPHVRRWEAAEGEIENHIKPRLGKRSLAELSRAHVRAMVQEIAADYPVAANRALARLNAVLNWAVSEDLIEANPAAGVKKPTREQPVSRVLDDDELREVWAATEALGHPARQFLQVLLLTGQRRDDVRLMSWGELNLDEATWTIPAARYKSRRAHLVPLAPAALAILEAMPFRDRGGYVFSASEGEKPYANVQRPKAALDRAVLAARQKEDPEAETLEPWTLHDLRRTCRTGLSRLGIRSDIAERVIGHSVGGRLGATYDLYEFAEEKRRALEAWESHVLALGQEKVVELAARR